MTTQIPQEEISRIRREERQRILRTLLSPVWRDEELRTTIAYNFSTLEEVERIKEEFQLDPATYPSKVRYDG